MQGQNIILAGRVMFRKTFSFVLSIVVFTQVISCARRLGKTSQVTGGSDKCVETIRHESSIAHLHSGFMVAYPHGCTVPQDTIRTAGFKYSGFSADKTMISRLPMNEVDYIEHTALSQRHGKMTFALSAFNKIFVGIITFTFSLFWKFVFPDTPLIG